MAHYPIENMKDGQVQKQSRGYDSISDEERFDFVNDNFIDDGEADNTEIHGAPVAQEPRLEPQLASDEGEGDADYAFHSRDIEKGIGVNDNLTRVVSFIDPGNGATRSSNMYDAAAAANAGDSA